MSVRRKNNRLEPDGNKPQRFGGALDAVEDDDLVTKRQLTSSIGGELVTDEGQFTNVDPNNAIRITMQDGTVVYLPIFIYP